MRAPKAARVLFGVVLLASMSAACAGLKARRTGFLSDYSGLEKTQGKEEWVYVSPIVQADTYSGFIVDPIQIHLDESNAKRFTTEEVEELAQFFCASVVEKLSESRQVVTEPGPGVARIRIALTGIRRSKALANILPVGRLVGPAWAELPWSPSGSTRRMEIRSQPSSWRAPGAGSRVAE